MGANDCQGLEQAAITDDLAKTTCDNPQGPDLYNHSCCPHLSCLTVLRPCSLLPARAVCELRAGGRPESYCSLKGKNSRPTWANRWRSALSRHKELWAIQARQAGEPNNMRGSIPVKKPMSEANSLTGFQGLKRTLMSEEGVTVFSLSGLWNALWNKARLVCKFCDEGVNPEGLTLQTNKEKMWAFKRMPYFLFLKICS